MHVRFRNQRSFEYHETRENWHKDHWSAECLVEGRTVPTSAPGSFLSSSIGPTGERADTGELGATDGSVISVSPKDSS